MNRNGYGRARFPLCFWRSLFVLTSELVKINETTSLIDILMFLLFPIHL